MNIDLVVQRVEELTKVAAQDTESLHKVAEQLGGLSITSYSICAIKKAIADKLIPSEYDWRMDEYASGACYIVIIGKVR